GVGDLILAEVKRKQFLQQLTNWRKNGARIVIYFQTEGEIERFREIMAEANGALDGIELLEGTLARGFCFPTANLVILAAAEVLAIEFANEARLYVPLEQSYLISRYVGVGKKSPALSSLADAKWARAKKNAAASIFDYAGKMLALQAERETQLGHAFGPDTKWQSEFEHSFPFRETPDQLTAITATKNDMERARSMDRLICGDVGFGKTEVAIRAAFKAVMEGKQIAVLAPTTVLAQQHFETFRQRMLDYPVRI